MLSKVRSFSAVALAAAAFSAALPAGAATARLAPCRVSSIDTGFETTVLVEGHWADTAGGDVDLACHLVQGGVKVASAREDVYGPVAAISSVQRIPAADFTVCYEVAIAPFNPWGPYYYDSDC